MQNPLTIGRIYTPQPADLFYEISSIHPSPTIETVVYSGYTPRVFPYNRHHTKPASKSIQFWTVELLCFVNRYNQLRCAQLWHLFHLLLYIFTPASSFRLPGPRRHLFPSHSSRYIRPQQAKPTVDFALEVNITLEADPALAYSTQEALLRSVSAMRA